MNISDKDFIKICKESNSIAEVIKKMGNIPAGGNYEIVKLRIKRLNIDTSHFKGQGWAKGITYKKPEKKTPEEVLKINSNVTQKFLRNYIKRNNLMEYKCKFCGSDGNWLWGKITLELDHINGIKSDCRLENLRYLCPNCHGLTDTYRGKNKKKK